MLECVAGDFSKSLVHGLGSFSIEKDTRRSARLYKLYSTLNPKEMEERLADLLTHLDKVLESLEARFQ